MFTAIKDFSGDGIFEVGGYPKCRHEFSIENRGCYEATVLAKMFSVSPYRAGELAFELNQYLGSPLTVKSEVFKQAINCPDLSKKILELIEWEIPF